jgi:hypothetical protein
MTHLKPNQIKFDGGAIVIQSCDEETANIGVFQNGKNAYHHVSIPDFIREWRVIYYTDLPIEEYDHILSENKTEILQVVHRLNEPGASST